VKDDKNAGGYRYWVRERQDHLYENNRPTKVDEGQKPEPKSQATSAWNTAGTWEDRDLSSDIFQKALEEHWVSS